MVRRRIGNFAADRALGSRLAAATATAPESATPNAAWTPANAAGPGYDLGGSATMSNAVSNDSVFTKPPPRDSVGGAFQQRKQLYIRVTVAPGKRVAERAPWATSLAEARARGELVQSWINRLQRGHGQPGAGLRGEGGEGRR